MRCYDIHEGPQILLKKRRAVRNRQDETPTSLYNIVVDPINPNDKELWLLSRHGNASLQAWKVHTTDTITEYLPYPRLYVERKYCRIKPGKTFPLMNLPREIRDIIFGHISPTNGVFELWSREHERRSPIWKSYKSQSAKILKLLRVSKQFYGEIGSLFYGTNEFRFSGMNGIVALSTFINTIGPAAGFLTKVCMHVPLCAQLQPTSAELHWGTFVWDQCCLSEYVRGNLNDFFKRRLMQPVELPGLDAHVEYIGKQLKNLRSLVLVIPKDLQLRNEPFAHKTISETLQYLQALPKERTSLRVSFVITGRSGNRDKTLPLTSQALAFDDMLREIGNERWNVKCAKNTNSGTWQFASEANAS